MDVKVQNLPYAQVQPGQNDRTVFRPEELEALAASIQADGLIQPITVRPTPGGRFEIVAGERRYRAIGLLGWETVPAIVRDLTDEQASTIMLLENVHRVDIDPVDEARAYQSRIDRFDHVPRHCLAISRGVLVFDPVPRSEERRIRHGARRDRVDRTRPQHRHLISGCQLT